MARLTDTQRELIMADYHIGKSQNEIAKKYEVSPATINKLCKGIEPKHLDKVNTLTRINIELSQESECEVNAIQKEVNERIKHIDFFNKVTYKNINAMSSKLDESLTIVEHKHAQETIAKAKETVLGKEASTQVNIQNNTTINQELIAGAKELLQERLAKLNEPRLIESQ
jgi:DNA-binding MurR/RpiR family transcriptional regulator